MRDAAVSNRRDLLEGQRQPRGFGSVQRKPNGDGWTYYAVVRVDGKPKWLSAGPTREDAEHLLRLVWFGVVDPTAYGRKTQPVKVAVEAPQASPSAVRPSPRATERVTLARGLGALTTELPDDCSIAEFATAWVEYLEGLKADGRRKPETCNEYGRIARNIIVPALGDREVRSIGAADAWALVVGRMEGTVPTRPGSKCWQMVSRDRALRELAALRVMLGEAKRHRLLTENPCMEVEGQVKDSFKQNGRPTVALTRGEADRLVEAVSSPHRTHLLLLARTGCRLGESFALTIDDFDEATGVLSISKSWSHSRLVPPKSDAGIRELRIPPGLAALLSEQCRLVDVPQNRLRLMFPSTQWGHADPGHWRTAVFRPAVEDT